MSMSDAHMLIDVRTTVRIDDDLYRQIKQRAANENRTVAAVLEDAVRIGMDSGPSDRQLVSSFTVVGGSTEAQRFERSNREWHDLLDDEAPIDRRR